LKVLENYYSKMYDRPYFGKLQANMIGTYVLDVVGSRCGSTGRPFGYIKTLALIKKL
jgi:hypothetical protein